MNVEISNLYCNLTGPVLRRLFMPFGEMNTVMVIRNQLNNRPGVKAAVDMPADKEGKQALALLHGTVLAGKTICLRLPE